MNRIILLTALILSFNRVMAGPVKTEVMSDPDRITQIIKTGTYPDLLGLVRSAYDESKRENGDPVTDAIYKMALTQAPIDKQIKLAIDFSLVQSDKDTLYSGAKTIIRALCAGENIDESARNRGVDELIAILERLRTPSREAYRLASETTDALILLESDSGLDTLLTCNTIVRNYTVVDGWDAKSNASVFEHLLEQYVKIADTEKTTTSPFVKIKVAFYRLCLKRRLQDIEIIPLHPVTNLDNLRPR